MFCPWQQKDCFANIISNWNRHPLMISVCFPNRPFWPADSKVVSTYFLSLQTKKIEVKSSWSATTIVLSIKTLRQINKEVGWDGWPLGRQSFWCEPLQLMLLSQQLMAAREGTCTRGTSKKPLMLVTAVPWGLPWTYIHLWTVVSLSSLKASEQSRTNHSVISKSE